MIKNTNINVNIAVPMPSNEVFENEKIKYKGRTALYETIEELCSLSGQLEFHLFEYGIHIPEISLADEVKRNEVKKYFSHQITKQFEKHEIIIISCNIPFSEKLVEDSDRFPAEVVSKFLIRTYFCKRVFNLFVMANICRVGSIEIADSGVIQDGFNFFDRSSIPKMDSWALQRSVILSEKIGWPRFQNVGLARAWQWSIDHGYLSDEFNNNPTERALSAFTRLFDYKTREEPMQLLWALIGIEAFYVRGKSALTEQVKEKSQIFLGKYESYKKKINDMYDFRSRFIHGDLNFPSLCFIFDASDELHRYDEKLLESIDLAIAILSATLQKIILKNWSGVTFDYKAFDSNPKAP